MMRFNKMPFIFVLILIVFAYGYTISQSITKAQTSPSSQNSPSIIITEFMANPQKVPDSKGEWVEVKNLATQSANISGWKVYDGQNHTISGDFTIEASSSAVICRDASSLVNGGLKCHYTAHITLANSTSNIILKNADASLIDSISYLASDIVDGHSTKVAFDPNRTLSQETTFTYGLGDFGTPADSIVTAKAALSIDISSNLKTHKVTIATSTAITKDNGEGVDMDKITASVVSTDSLSAVPLGKIVDAALRWGLTNATLLFSQPIRLELNIGNDLNGQTLSVLRSSSGSSDWTNEGIVAPATCLVSLGTCAFQATKASYFIATHAQPTPTPTPLPTPTPTLAPATTSQKTAENSYVCNDEKPKSPPILVDATPYVDSVTLKWMKAKDPVSYYLVGYGLEPGKHLYGNPNVGTAETTSFTIHELETKTRYYFQVKAGNGCALGDFSNELSAIPLSPYVNPKEPTTIAATSVLATTSTQFYSPTPVSAQPIKPSITFWAGLLNFYSSLLQFLSKIF